VGGWVQFSNLHRSGTDFPRKSCCVFGAQNVPAPFSGGAVSDLWVNFFSWLVRKRPPCFLDVFRPPLEMHAVFLKFQETHEERTPSFSKLLRNSPLKNDLFLMGTVSKRGTSVHVAPLQGYHKKPCGRRSVGRCFHKIRTPREKPVGLGCLEVRQRTKAVGPLC